MLVDKNFKEKKNKDTDARCTAKWQEIPKSHRRQLTSTGPVHLLNAETADRWSGELFILYLSNAFMNTTAFNFKAAWVRRPGSS